MKNSSVNFRQSTVLKPIEQVRYHVDHKPRLENPTYNSVFMTSSLNNFVASPYSKSLLKDTEYKKNYDKQDGSMASYESMLKSMGRTNQNANKAANGSFNFSINRTTFRQSGQSSLASSQSSNY